ncbi:MAG: hypothetical protein A2W00_04875 [Candidatus Eisenbacteria bacterium RBG_16_71_46]|nr:MAG: hypothetical protein A2W00_04875 [Candidatus Eisenbacteria bacterium RBG_16_71_46]
MTLEGETCYRIAAYHRMRPFLMSIASDTDLWMFVTSGGGLTAGRRDPDGALFPYETVDKLHDAHHHTGPITLLRVAGADGHTVLWEPFSAAGADDPGVERNLYKNVIGNRLVFEEIHRRLKLAFRYRWSGSDACGLVRTASLENLGSRAVSLTVLDGLRNVLPYGAPLALYEHSSGLVDAYKRTDLDTATGLGIFSLTARITDRAEAAEELRANTVWCHGPDAPTVCLSLDAVQAFRRGEPVSGETVFTGRRGNYLVVSPLEIEPRGRATWHIVADVAQSHVQIAALRSRLLAGGDPGAWIEQSLDQASENLLRNVASADGLQLTGHPEATVHHFANVLFNNMRGGVFARNYDVPTADLIAFLRTRNRAVAARHQAALASLPAQIAAPELIVAAEKWGDADLVRLCHEYLPIYFGRRHGDPSRPWNRFAIHVKNPDGSMALSYEGNWRDIFQNWEALCASFPRFLPNLIAKFVNASTVDGFNPYRITRDGVDWEVVDPHDPWSYIGYWGDHQIVYLLRFLEALERYSPGALQGLLAREIFCYADVPYRLKPYQEIVANPRATIRYDTELAARIERRVAAIGTDGKLLPGGEGSVYHVNLLEKLLVPALSKLSNLVPDGGIWMNTQRPEWNDANNALAGNGVSVVTLLYLRRYLGFVERVLEGLGETRSATSTEVVAWLRRLHTVLAEHRPAPGSAALDGGTRKRLLDALGGAFSAYRDQVYANGLGGKQELPVAEVVAFCRCALEHVDHAIRANRRADGLYHSYNLLAITNDRRQALLQPLQEMLEGQVAALASGVVEPPEAVRMLASLFKSRLYRADQKSFLLYPEKKLPEFLERNVVPDERAVSVPLLRELLEAQEPSIIARDALGVCRFQGDLGNAPDLAAALDRLAQHERWREPVARDRQAVLDVFEAVFQHHAFTGRSGTMYAYEGLGCVYWHMVSKLLLAVQEIALQAARGDQPAAVCEALALGYQRIRAGLGFEKTVAEYGAFPTDPYSHTPPHAGAQQPGMTGQVKEGILARFGELGVQVEGGIVSFRPVLLGRSEIVSEARAYRFYDLEGELRSLDVPPGALAFSFCQTPVVYEPSRGEAWIRVTAGDGTSTTHAGDQLDPNTSQALFARQGGISRIDVGVPEGALRGL